MAKPKTSRETFAPNEAQRAFVAAASGVGVPPRIIRRLLPGARPGDVMEISGKALQHSFSTELRRGVNLALSLAAARLFQIALSSEERQSMAALRLVLQAPEAWRALATSSRKTAPKLLLERLSREDRQALRKLIGKATARPVPGAPIGSLEPAGRPSSERRGRGGFAEGAEGERTKIAKRSSTNVDGARLR